MQLIRSATDEHLWANYYDGDLANAMAVLADVTRAIATEVKITLTPQQQERLAVRKPANPEAQDAHLMGRYYLNRFSLDTAVKSREFFQKAIDIDRAYARAYAGMALSYGISAVLGGGYDPETILYSGRPVAQRKV